MNHLSPIGIFGGTFDPIHLGHIKIAEQALQLCYLQKIIFIPCHTPPHRYQPIATPAQRLIMVKLAVENYPNFIVDNREIKRDAISFTIDTLKSLKLEYPQNPLVIIMGADAFAKLDTWHQWEKLLDYAHLAVVNRSEIKTKLSTPIENLLKNTEIFDPHAFQHQQHGLIYQLHINPIKVSATKIRQQLSNAETPIDMLAKNVYTYIQKEKIYYANSKKS